MSNEQFSALLTKLQEDVGLREKLQGAADLDAAVALAKEAGFDVSKADWLKDQEEQSLKLGDAELEAVVGGQRVEVPGSIVCLTTGSRECLPSIKDCP